MDQETKKEVKEVLDFNPTITEVVITGKILAAGVGTWHCSFTETW